MIDLFRIPLTSRGLEIVYKSPPAPVKVPEISADAGIYAPEFIVADSFEFFLYGSVAGVNLPPGYVLPVLWEKVDGPGVVIFEDPTVAHAACNFTLPGVYHLRISTFYGNITASDTAEITIGQNLAPQVFAGTGASLTLSGGTVGYVPNDATLIDDGVPHAATLTWTQVSGPGTAAFSDIHALKPTITFSVAGNYVLRLTADDGYLQGASDTAFTINAEVVANHTVTIITHGAGAAVTSTPSGVSINDYRPFGDASYSFNDWVDGTSITLVFSDEGNTGKSAFKVNGVFAAMTTVTAPDINGDGGAYSYTFTIHDNITLEYYSVPEDF